MEKLNKLSTYSMKNIKTNDEWYTPEYAIYPILKYIKPKSTIWCPFDKNESNFVKIFTSKEHKVINTHIEYGQDFFDEKFHNCDYIISNPPYSYMDKVLDKLINFNVPFAMLVNIYRIFDSKKRFKLAMDNDLSVMYLYPRINFISPKDGISKNVMWQSGYLCYKMLPEKMMFEYVKSEVV